MFPDRTPRGVFARGVFAAHLPRTRVALRLLLIGLTIGLLAFSTPVMAKQNQNNRSNNNRANRISAKIAKFETHWLEKSIDRHARILAVVAAADDRTTNEQLLAFCGVFAAQEQQEMTTMTTMLRTWYNVQYTPRRVSNRSLELDEDETGAQFDLELVGRLLGYNNSEIAEARQAIRSAGHQELKTLAANIIAINRAENVELREWLRAWDDDDDDDQDD